MEEPLTGADKTTEPALAGAKKKPTAAAPKKKKMKEKIAASTSATTSSSKEDPKPSTPVKSKPLKALDRMVDKIAQMVSPRKPDVSKEALVFLF